MTLDLNRETWLTQAVGILREGLFQPAGAAIPELRLSVGLPHARNQRDTLIQYFAPEFTADRIGQIFVNPSVDTAESALTQLFNLLNTRFAVGYGVTFGADTQRMITEVIGSYPNSALTLPEVKAQSTRMIKFDCPKCGWTGRATQRWLSKGMPTCYCGTRMAREDLPF